MKEHFLIPHWRYCSTPIRLLENPTEAWWRSVEYVRFCLLTDGRFIFGDGQEITHADMTRAGKETLEKSGPYMVGVLDKRSGSWVMKMIQMYWGAGLDYPDQFDNGKKLLSHLLTWKEVTDIIGQVEFVDPRTYGFSNQ